MSAARLFPLKPDQARAVDPDTHAWVSASAGTGKTQVLSARVLRLLLGGTPPERILCLTFTKLAAAEMQTRIFDRLAHWVRCPDDELASDLAALRASPDHAGIARGLFAQVLDAPGGLQVQTLHAFAQSLIASFPLEADVAPGFATLDDRSALTLRRRLLSEAIEAATQEGDEAFLADLAEISIASGERRLGQVVAAILAEDEALRGFRIEGVEALVRRNMDLPPVGGPEDALASGLAAVDATGIARLATALEAVGQVNALKCAGQLRAWLAVDAVAGFPALYDAFVTKAGTPRLKLVPVAAQKADASLEPFAATVADRLCALHAEQQRYAAAVFAARHLRVGIRLAHDWRQAKARLGVVDYDDMIEAAVRLLEGEKAAEWVRFKLDSRIDHLLVDEAQDTNAAQWKIIERLTEEYFAGEGARADVQRTLFVVGDFKQSIFSFQGAKPALYRDQQDVFRQPAEDARHIWQSISLETNFRSVGAVLDVVDAVIDGLGHEAFGLREAVPKHVPHRAGLAGR